jgi:predicted nucleic acid-binding Zn ribbon protein
VFHPAPIVFKGSGFYVTDNRKAPPEPASEPKAEASKSNGDSGTKDGDSGAKDVEPAAAG